MSLTIQRFSFFWFCWKVRNHFVLSRHTIGTRHYMHAIYAHNWCKTLYARNLCTQFALTFFFFFSPLFKGTKTNFNFCSKYLTITKFVKLRDVLLRKLFVYLNYCKESLQNKQSLDKIKQLTHN